MAEPRDPAEPAALAFLDRLRMLQDTGANAPSITKAVNLLDRLVGMEARIDEEIGCGAIGECPDPECQLRRDLLALIKEAEQ